MMTMREAASVLLTPPSDWYVDAKALIDQRENDNDNDSDKTFNIEIVFVHLILR